MFRLRSTLPPARHLGLRRMRPWVRPWAALALAALLGGCVAYPAYPGYPGYGYGYGYSAPVYVGGYYGGYYGGGWRR
jgi:hypothetical protein